MPGRVGNWFDPRNRAPASEYGDQLPEDAARAAQPGAVAATAGHNIGLDGNLDPREKQPPPEPQLLRVINLDAPQPQGDGPREVQMQGSFEGEQANQQLLDMEMERQRQEAYSTFQKLQAVYQRLLGKR